MALTVDFPSFEDIVNNNNKKKKYDAFGTQVKEAHKIQKKKISSRKLEGWVV